MRSPVPVTLVAAVLAGLLCPAASHPQDPASAFADSTARRLVTDALARARSVPEGAGTARAGIHRFRAGFLIPEQWAWRARTLLHKEVVGAVDLAPPPRTRIVTLERGSPLIGDDMMRRPPLWDAIGFDPEEEDPPLLGLLDLSFGTLVPDLPAGPTVGSYALFDTTFIDPLGDRALDAYRFRSERDLVTPDGRTLRAVHFRPAGDDADELTGVVWFDAATGAPVRTLVRPRSRWRVGARVRGLPDWIPLIPRRGEGAIDYLAVDYAARDGRVAGPAAIHLHGTMAMFWNQFVVPVQADWRLGPPGDPALPPPPLSVGQESPAEHGHLVPFLRELDRIAPPHHRPHWTGLILETLEGIRFNQAQGLSFPVAYRFPVAPRTTLRTELVISTAFQPTGAVAVEQVYRPWAYGLEAYSRMEHADRMESANSFSRTVRGLLSGLDNGSYYLASGGRAFFLVGDRFRNASLSLFAERQRGVDKTVDYSLFEPDSTAITAEIPVDDGDYYGVRARLHIQRGDDPQSGLVLARLYAEAAAGDQPFALVGTTTDLVGPLPGPFTGGLRVLAGVANRDAPGQVIYHLGGGYKTVRGYPRNTASGPAALVLTGEIGTSVPLVRLVAFGEVGWTDPLDRLLDGDPLTALGIGLSIGDGAVRIDFARGLAEGGEWQVAFGTSGIL